MFKIICTVFIGLFITSTVSRNNMFEYIIQLFSSWFYILSLTSVIMCIIAAWYFDWFQELRYPELRSYAKLWRYEYKDVPIKRITLHKFYSPYRKEFEKHPKFGILKPRYVILFEIDCPAEDFKIETAHDDNNPCRQFIADTEYFSILKESPKFTAFIDYPFYTVYKRFPPIKDFDFRSEWYFVPIKYGDKPIHTFKTIKKWGLYPDCRFFTQQITAPDTRSRRV